MLCHGCDTVLPHLWHDSRTDVSRSFHSRGTTYFFERVIYFLGKGIYFFGRGSYFLGAARIFCSSVRKASASR